MQSAEHSLFAAREEVSGGKKHKKQNFGRFEAKSILYVRYAPRFPPPQDSRSPLDHKKTGRQAGKGSSSLALAT